jgi:hypothetical protein
LWNFGQGWLEPWIPPPGGELHLQRGGWVNTASGFFSREFDPTFTFNAGTSGTRDEYEGAASSSYRSTAAFKLASSCRSSTAFSMPVRCHQRPVSVMWSLHLN